jgi:hypothetical protein
MKIKGNISGEWKQFLEEKFAGRKAHDNVYGSYGLKFLKEHGDQIVTPAMIHNALPVYLVYTLDCIERDPRDREGFIVNMKDEKKIGQVIKTEIAFTPSEDIRFTVGGKVILTIDKDGLVYKDERVKDAGEAHKAFIETMAQLGVKI